MTEPEPIYSQPFYPPPSGLPPAQAAIYLDTTNVDRTGPLPLWGFLVEVKINGRPHSSRGGTLAAIDEATAKLAAYSKMIILLGEVLAEYITRESTAT